jgi:exodeoxyribonuclease V beta subunit
VASEPEVAEKDDEPATAVGAAERLAGGLQDVPVPMAELPGGTAFGTLVHAVLERVDTGTVDLAAEVSLHVAEQLARFGPADLDADALGAALLPALRTPLGALAGERCLADIVPGDRLAELDFELPLGGGDRPGRPSRLAALAGVLRTHLPAAEPLRAYAEQLADPVLGDALLEGYLTGSIDAVLRIDGRNVVLDYKTNRLGVPDTPLTAWDYRGAALTDAMLQAHYPLQALLYEVALHRMLRWRLSDYDPQRHLGGALYLFLRGMAGPETPRVAGVPHGVFSWRPPAALITALSDLLDRGPR